jgi:hypothetical protein
VVCVLVIRWLLSGWVRSYVERPGERICEIAGLAAPDPGLTSMAPSPAGASKPTPRPGIHVIACSFFLRRLVRRELDRRGWDELTSALAACFGEVEQIRHDSKDGLATSGEESIPVTFGMLGFESPPPPPLPKAEG